MKSFPEPDSSLMVDDSSFSVEPFFNDDSEWALRSQVRWFGEKLRFGDPFFSKLLRVDPAKLHDWEEESGNLSEDEREHLKEFWQLVLHLLSFYDYDLPRTREMFSHVAGAEREHVGLQFFPPWAGVSLARYLEDCGPDAIYKVNRWLQDLRFSNA
jgi:hypothetical protein